MTSSHDNSAFVVPVAEENGREMTWKDHAFMTVVGVAFIAVAAYHFGAVPALTAGVGGVVGGTAYERLRIHRHCEQVETAEVLD